MLVSSYLILVHFAKRYKSITLINFYYKSSPSKWAIKSSTRKVWFFLRYSRDYFAFFSWKNLWINKFLDEAKFYQPTEWCSFEVISVIGYSKGTIMEWQIRFNQTYTADCRKKAAVDSHNPDCDWRNRKKWEKKLIDGRKLFLKYERTILISFCCKKYSYYLMRGYRG